MNMISIRTQQRPQDQLSLQSLQNQRGCLRESLVALSERLTHAPVQQKELLVMSLADVVGKWQEVVPAGVSGEVLHGVFLSSQTLLDACFINVEAISISKDTMGVVLSSSKRVTCASLPDAVWAVENHQAQISVAQYVSALDKALPFFAVWQAVMPGVRIALKTIHGTLDPLLRQKFSTSNSMGLYYPPASLVRRAAGLPNIGNSQDECEGIRHSASTQSVSDGMVTVSKHLGELRVLLYQLLGQACSHKALYACTEHTAIICELSSILPWLENNQLSQLMKTFIESFVLNAPPVVFDVVAGFLEIFLTTTFRRLAVCWERSDGEEQIGGQEASMYKHIYRDCSIPLGFSGLDINVLENAKVTIFSELTRTYGDTLASFACCRGFLALDMPTSAALQSATMLGISTAPDEFQGSSKGTLQGATSGGKGKKGTGKGVKSNLKHLDAIPESELDPISLDSETRLKQHKALRRKALSSLLMGNPRYQQAVTAPFVASAVTLIGLPDTTACRRGILIGEHLASESRADKRLLAAVGKDAFSAALSVLLQQVLVPSFQSSQHTQHIQLLVATIVSKFLVTLIH